MEINETHKEAVCLWITDYDDYELNYVLTDICCKTDKQLYRGMSLDLAEVYEGNSINFRNNIVSWTIDERIAKDFMEEHLIDNPNHIGVILKLKGLDRCLDVYEFAEENIQDEDIARLARCECEVLTKRRYLDGLKISYIENKDGYVILEMSCE